MFKDIFILLVAYFVEIVHVELPDKGWEISMSEVDWKNLLFKAFNVEDSEVCAFFVPKYDVSVGIVLNS